MTGFRVGLSTVGGPDVIGGPLNFTVVLELAGGIGLSGTLVRPLTSIVKGGSISPSSSVSKNATKLVFGVISPDGTVAKSPRKLLSGSLLLAGVVSVAAAVDFARMTIEILDKIVPSIQIIEKVRGILSIDGNAVSIEINGG